MKRLVVVLAAVASLTGCDQHITDVLPPDYWCSYFRTTQEKLYAPTLGDTLTVTMTNQYYYVCAKGMPDTTKLFHSSP